jgi:hypothetical protein
MVMTVAHTPELRVLRWDELQIILEEEMKIVGAADASAAFGL